MEWSWKGLLYSCKRVGTGGSARGLHCQELRAELSHGRVCQHSSVCQHSDAHLLAAGACFVLLQLRSLRNLVQLGSEAVPSDPGDMFGVPIALVVKYMQSEHQVYSKFGISPLLWLGVHRRSLEHLRDCLEQGPKRDPHT